MNIKGHGKVSVIRLTHKGCEMNLEHILPTVYMESVKVEPSTIAFWEFKDTMEIDAMIYMLKEFKKMCECEMGRWVYRHDGD